MQRVLVIAACAVVAACARPAGPSAPTVPATSPMVAVPAGAPQAAVSPWADIPVRVMTWTSRGVQQLGTLPETDGKRLPQPMPALWYVEPMRKLDEAGLARLVTLVRDERVPGLSLRGQPVVARPGGLGALRELPAVKALVLDDTDVDGAALAAVQLSLARLYLAATAIDDAAVEAIAQRYPALEVLDVAGTAVGDAGARAIGRLANLHAVNLSETQITDDGGAALAGLQQLVIADLGSTRVGAKTVTALRELPLHELFLDHTRVRGEIALLAPLAPGLVRFDISDTHHHASDGELSWLTAATHLVELGLSGAKLHDPLALILTRLPEVRYVRLADTEITAAVVHAVAARGDLEEVDLAGTPVDDASAALLIGAPAMRMLRLDATQISDAALAGTPGPQLTELYVSRTSLGDAGLAILAQLPHLTGLGVGHTQVGDAGLARIAQLTELRTLVLSNVQAEPESFARLASLSRLERLYLDRTHAGDSALAALAAAHENLRILHLAGSDVSDDGLPALRQLTELTELTVGDTRMHGGIADLSAWPRLRTLSLTGLDINDQALPKLAERTSLVLLDLSATEVRDPALLAALPRLRTLGVAQARLTAAGNASLKKLAARGVEIVR